MAGVVRAGVARGEGCRAQGPVSGKRSQTSRPGIPGLSSVSQEGREKMLHEPLQRQAGPLMSGGGARKSSFRPTSCVDV